jgi:hypothetical protein
MKKHHLIILGGNSLGNKKWVQEMNNYLRQSYATSKFYYSHWDTENGDIDFEKEFRRLSKLLKNKNIQNYSIVAKSAGFILALQGIANGVLRPRTVVGYGLPIEYAEYRGINLKTLIEHSAKAASVICVQAYADPQGSYADTEKFIVDMIPLLDIEGQTHDYNQFESMSNIAKEFVSMHQPQCERKIEKVEGKSLQEVINIVAQNPKKYSFKNNWLFDPDSRLCAFRFGNKKYVLKRGLLLRILKEKENATKLDTLIKKTIIGKKKLVVVVPDVYTINSQEGYILSEYIGPDCNELFYLGRKNVLSWQNINDIQKKLCGFSVLHRSLLPRNTIVVRDRVYLIDLEDIVFNAKSSDYNLSLATPMLVGWRNVSGVDNNDVQSAFPIHTQCAGHEGLNGYENAFKGMTGSTGEDDEIRKLTCENIITATVYEHYASLLKIDDVLHYLSDSLPVEMEVLIDLLLSIEYGKGKNSLYKKLSNVVKIVWLQASLNACNEEAHNLLLLKVRNILFMKITSEYPEQEISDSVRLLIKDGNSKFEPTQDYLLKVHAHLSPGV